MTAAGGQGSTAGAEEVAVGESAVSGPALVIGLLGPTGVGKTEVAVELARRLRVAWPAWRDGLASPAGGGPSMSRGRIISCDSMQVYKGFPVLTNQPPVSAGGEGGGVPHALVGFVDPEEEFSAAMYSAAARPLIDEDLSARGWALVVGGTGLYMRAALAPLALAPGGDPGLRARLEARATAEGLGVLYDELVSLDPEAAEKIDPRNSRRVIRALEAIDVTGQRWSGRSDLWAPDYYHPTLLVGLVTERGGLYRRIDLRAARMLRQGAVDEVRRFRDAHRPGEARPGSPGIPSAIGYPEIWRLLDGEQTLEETETQIAAATRRYARRQLTWLRKLKDAVIIDAQDREPGEVAEEILERALSGDGTRGSHRS